MRCSRLPVIRVVPDSVLSVRVSSVFSRGFNILSAIGFPFLVSNIEVSIYFQFFVWSAHKLKPGLFIKAHIHNFNAGL